MRFPTWLVVVAALLCGCDGASRKPGDRLDRDGEPSVSFVDGDDPKMNAAMKKAAETIDDFVKALERPAADQEMFAIKVGFGEGKTGEFMWLSPVTYKDGKFTGVLNNEPVHPQKSKLGDKVTASKEEVVDWMYADGGVLVGGYTLRVLRDSLPPAERAQFDAGLPMRIE